MSRVFSVRLADDLAGRVMEIAAARGVKAPTILKAAVEGFVDDFGLPDAPSEGSSAASPEQVRREAVRASTATQPSTVHVINERQARLNAAKYGRSA